MSTNRLLKPSLGVGLGTLFLLASGPALAQAGAGQTSDLLFRLYNLPDWLLVALVVVLCMGLSWLGLALYRWFQRGAAAQHNPRAGYYAIAGGAIAGIVVALIAAGPWQNYMYDQITRLPPTAAGPSAKAPQDLLEEPDAVDAGKIPDKPLKVRNGRARHAKVRMSALDAETLNLNLFDDTHLTAVRDRVVENFQGSSVLAANLFPLAFKRTVVENLRGGLAWVGHIDGEKNSEVVLAAKGNVLMGTVRTQDRFFEIVYVNGNTHAVRELDPNKIPAQFEPQEALIPAEEGDKSASTDSVTTSGDITTSTGQVIDIAVVYSPQARNNAGGATGIETKIMNAVTRANQAYLNSQIDMQLNLVYMGEVAYTETGNMSDALSRLRSTTDGYIDDVHSLRDQYAADQVVLISADSNYCGIAYTMNSSWISTAFAPYAFAVLHDDSVYNCLGSYDSFAHELGHNQGNAHDPDSSSSPGAYPDSYGYRICGLFRDIMSYNCSGEPRIPYFSNPDVLYNGQPIGVPGFNDTARSMTETSPIAASFRTPANMPTVPATPSNLAASTATADSIQVTWNDAATDETGYKLQRSMNGGTWTEIAALGQNVTSFTNTGLSEGQYAYRAYAYNSVGNSGYSNMDSATIQAQEPIAPPPADTTAPVVTIADPKNGDQVSKNVAISVIATDEGGISMLRLYIDNELVSATNSSSTTYRWNTNKMSGSHTLRAEAVDTSNNASSTSITVSIK
ncbi:MAG: fibronectin type III domain-containing protein [Candidatus Competibacteraceae bacterium]|nr:fibronectin type III domain-containing protein [Candidatus Competibacteraceae bacterium]MCP5125989.1 fibronectin type III domain-containing protein [Gammaproteobacteria bacterium]HRX70721.1 M12 family metallo-peptidase [Candidatus Competibacteraceae bacterium]